MTALNKTSDEHFPQIIIISLASYWNEQVHFVGKINHIFVRKRTRKKEKKKKEKKRKEDEMVNPFKIYQL